MGKISGRLHFVASAGIAAAETISTDSIEGSRHASASRSLRNLPSARRWCPSPGLRRRSTASRGALDDADAHKTVVPAPATFHHCPHRPAPVGGR